MSYIRGGGRGKPSTAANTCQQQQSWAPGRGPAQATAEKRFSEASKKHRESAKRHIERIDNEDSVAEKERDGADILEKVISSYYQGDRGDDEALNSLSRTREIFNSMLSEDSNVCLVCLDTIQRTQPIWSCGSCYSMLHLQCIQQWINEGSYQQKLQALSDQHFPNKRLPWQCPMCRTDYQPEATPTVYKCFCGAEVNPVDDPWGVPHSCGETCGRKLQPECGHHCLLLCHPGPCPPCPKSVTVRCHCGRSPPSNRRCGSKAWSCRQTCGKQLGCRQHACQQPCHPGECGACPRVSVQRCRCGKRKEERLCAEADWSCQQVCGKMLSCGHHRCEQTCHSEGACGDCARATKERQCPCGKSTVSQLPCTEDVPCCGDTCGKALACQVHTCTEKCHYGKCCQCLQMSLKSCRCGAKQKELPCTKDFTCETRCTNIKACGRHQCKRRCCDGTSCPPCELVCGKKLNCGNHKCTSPCHTGPCYPCPVTVSKRCACEAAVISVPCIRSKTCQPPRCRLRCQRSPKCDHPSIQSHPCHFGDCPPCSVECGKKLSDCEHKCPVRCHDSVKVKVTPKAAPAAGPWEEKVTSYYDVVRKPCPPCVVPIPTGCLGGHEVSDLPCSSCQPYNCHRPCGRLLACGNHYCSKECHTVTGAPNDKAAGINCGVCEEGCSKPRPDGCSHTCLKPCHPGSCPPCSQRIKTRCHCGTAVFHFPCSEWNDPDLNRDKKMECQGPCPKELFCGHPCDKLCHPGGCTNTIDCSKKVSIRCSCRARKESHPCYQAKNIVVACDETCAEKKASEQAKQEESARSESDAAASESALPDRQKRRRRRQRGEVEEIPEPIDFRKYGPMFAKVLAVLVLFGAVYLAINAEN